MDFENIELKETERGDFTEITISSLSSEKSKSKEEKIKEQNDLLFSLYQELNFGNNNIINNNGNQNFGNKNNILSKTCIELGARVILTDIREDALATTLAGLPLSPTTEPNLSFTADLTDAEQMAALVDFLAVFMYSSYC